VGNFKIIIRVLIFFACYCRGTLQRRRFEEIVSRYNVGLAQAFRLDGMECKEEQSLLELGLLA
jgi:hypothetical protein